MLYADVADIFDEIVAEVEAGAKWRVIDMAAETWGPRRKISTPRDTSLCISD